MFVNEACVYLPSTNHRWQDIYLRLWQIEIFHHLMKRSFKNIYYVWSLYIVSALWESLMQRLQAFCIPNDSLVHPCGFHHFFFHLLKVQDNILHKNRRGSLLGSDQRPTPFSILFPTIAGPLLTTYWSKTAAGIQQSLECIFSSLISLSPACWGHINVRNTHTTHPAQSGFPHTISARPREVLI